MREGVRRGFEVDDIFKELLDKAPDVIDKAAQSPLGLAALSVLVLGIVGVLLFRKATGKLKLVAFAMITSGFLGFMALVFDWSLRATIRRNPISQRQRRRTLARANIALSRKRRSSPNVISVLSGNNPTQREKLFYLQQCVHGEAGGGSFGSFFGQPRTPSGFSSPTALI